MANMGISPRSFVPSAAAVENITFRLQSLPPPAIHVWGLLDWEI
jgi:hypothetical protein